MFLNAFKVTVSGAGTVLVSTVTSCAFAVVIESAAHRIQYRFFPHWYKDVKHAIGLPNLLNDQWHQQDQQQCLENEDIEEDNLTTQSEDEIISWDGSERKIEISDHTRIGIINLEDKSFYDDFREDPSNASRTQFQMYQDKLQDKKDFIEINRDLVLSCAMTG